MKISKMSFRAKIDKNTMNFLINAREKNLDTRKMETLMKQISPEATVTSAVDYNNDLIFMYLCNNGFTNILPSKLKYSNTDKPYITNQTTVDLITSKLERIKRKDKNSNNKAVTFHKIYKRDHKAELKEIFGEPEQNCFDDNVSSTNWHESETYYR